MPMIRSPRLPLLAALLLAPLSPAADFSIQEIPGKHIDVLQDGKVVGRYMTDHDISTPEKHNLNYKPYLHIFDAEGKAPITKGAGGDFPHHRGIYIGWMKIGVNGKTYDRWHMKGGDQVHEKVLEQSGGSLTSLVKWMGEGRDVIVEEQRTMAFLPPASSPVRDLTAGAPVYAVVDFTSKLKAVAGDTTFDGDPEHAGLQFRPAQEVDRSQTTYIYPKEKADAHKDLDYPWFGETFVLNGQPYSVIYLNHPANPKGARISAYRDYGRFGAFFKTSAKKDETVTIKARFLVINGPMPAVEVIQKAWNDYAGATEPAPAVTLKPAEKPAPPKPKDAKAKTK